MANNRRKVLEMKILNRITLIVCFGALFYACQNPQPTPSETSIQEIYTAHPQNILDHSHLPYLTVGDDQNLYLSWVTQNDDSAYFFYAKWQEDAWGSPHLIASGTNWFVNWADYPMIAVNNQGQMLAHYLVKSDTSTYAYDVTMRSSIDGKTWSDPFTPHSDGTPTEHGFVSMMPLADGSYQGVWLDGRNTGGHAHGDSHSAMTLRTAQITVDGVISNEMELDSKVCDCCQTTTALLEGEPVVIYRDRSEDEVRDMYYTKITSGSHTTPTPLHEDQWKIAGCPVNGARSASKGDQIAVAWFTAAQNQPKVKVKFINASALTSKNALTIEDPNPMGRVDIDWIDSARVVVSWLSKTSRGAEIKIAELPTQTNDPSVTGMTPVKSIATSESRSSGFPQMAVYNQQIFLAWTELDSLGGTKISTTLLKRSRSTD